MLPLVEPVLGQRDAERQPRDGRGGVLGAVGRGRGRLVGRGVRSGLRVLLRGLRPRALAPIGLGETGAQGLDAGAHAQDGGQKGVGAVEGGLSPRAPCRDPWAGEGDTRPGDQKKGPIQHGHRLGEDLSEPGRVHEIRRASRFRE